MTEAKKTTDFSSRLGVKRSKPSTSKPPLNSPPRAATAPSSKPKKDEVQRRKNPFNDMLHTRSHKDKESKRSRDDTPRKSEDERHGDMHSSSSVYDARAAERIADLERALALMKQEQDVLRDDLIKMRETGAAYQETQRLEHIRSNSSCLQSPPGAYHSDSRPTSQSSQSAPIDVFDSDEPVRPPRRSSSNHHLHHHFHRDNGGSGTAMDATTTQDLRAQVAQLQDQLQTQEHLLHQSHLRAESEWHDLTTRLHTAEKESSERLQQLLSLKSSISSLTRMEAQCTDGELSERLSQLANRVREWVISNFRKTRLNHADLPHEVAQTLESISPRYRAILDDRLPLYQALIANALMHIFQEPLIVGVPDAGPLASLRQAAGIMRRDARARYADWRRCTVRSLEATEPQTILHERENTLHRLAGTINHQLFSLTGATITPHALQSLHGILGTAADLRRTLLLQKADYLVHFFRNHDGHEIGFDEERMESIHDLDATDEDGDAILNDRGFGFCVFPSLEKFGDEHGENPDVNNVLLKARVCCRIT